MPHRLTSELEPSLRKPAHLRPALPQPGALFPVTGARPLRLELSSWPAITLPGHADRRAAVDREALADLLLELRRRAWLLSLGWPERAGWRRQQAVLGQVLPVIGAWWLQWRDGAVLLPDELVGSVWRLARQRREGLDQALMVTDALGRPALLLSVAADTGAARCGWQRLLDELAPWPCGLDR